jgi:thiol-disulfide isomerase/thioredoxin
MDRMRRLKEVSLAILLLSVTMASAVTPPASGPSPSPVPSPLQRGETAPTFTAVGIDGVSRAVSYPQGTTTLLLFFSSGCPACHKMIPLWNNAYAKRPKNLAIIGIVVDPAPAEFFSQMPIAFPVLRSPGKAFLESFRIFRIPVTMRVNPGGRVDDAGVGPLDIMRINELFRP